MIITVPNNLRKSHIQSESVFALILQNLNQAPLTLDFSAVDFFYPYGTLALLQLARLIYIKTGYKTRIQNIRPDTHPYLDRIDLFQVGEAWLETNEYLPENQRWSRRSDSTNIYGIKSLDNERDIPYHLEQVAGILAYWLNEEEDQFSEIWNALNELCINSIRYSEDSPVFILVQKYHREQQQQNEVSIAVSDFGIGIPIHLRRAHPHLPDNSPFCILEAMNGRSGSHAGEGAGLSKIILPRVKTRGGNLTIRSLDGFVAMHPDGIKHKEIISFFPGTQVSLNLYSKIIS